MVRASHIVHDGGVEGLLERIQSVAKQRVCVGIPEEKNNRRDEDITNSDLLYIHTNGVRPTEVRRAMQPEIDKGTKYSIALQMYFQAHGSFSMRIPARPVIEPAIEDAKKGLSKLLIQAAVTSMDGGDFMPKLKEVGMYGQNAARGWFTNPKNHWPQNAESTIKKKKSDKPLINTSALRQSIVYVIRGADE